MVEANGKKINCDILMTYGTDQAFDKIKKNKTSIGSNVLLKFKLVQHKYVIKLFYS